MTLEDKKREIAKLFLASKKWNLVYSRYENRIGKTYESNYYSFCAEIKRPFWIWPFPPKPVLNIIHVTDVWGELDNKILFSEVITEEQYKQVKISAKNKQQKDQENQTKTEKDKEEKLINILYECLNNAQNQKGL